MGTRYKTIDEEHDLFIKVEQGGLPRSFSIEWYDDFHHDLYILRRFWLTNHAVLGTKKWLWLRPIFRAWDWTIDRWFSGWHGVIQYLEDYNWMSPEPGIKILPSTMFSWFVNSPNVRVLTAWLRRR